MSRYWSKCFYCQDNDSNRYLIRPHKGLRFRNNSHGEKESYTKVVSQLRLQRARSQHVKQPAESHIDCVSQVKDSPVELYHCLHLHRFKRKAASLQPLQITS